MFAGLLFVHQLRLQFVEALQGNLNTVNVGFRAKDVEMGAQINEPSIAKNFKICRNCVRRLADYCGQL